MSENEKSSISKFHLFFWAIIIVLFVVLKLYYDFYWPTATVRIKNKDLSVSVANNFKHWEKGLGGRKDLGKYDGMLFVFPTVSQHVFVMRDMRFSIDIVWIKKGVVVDIAPSLPLEPNSTELQLTPYPARDDSDQVLELPSGTAQTLNLRLGDKVNLVK